MLIVHLVLAGLAAGALARRSRLATPTILAAAALDVALGASATPALRAVAPLLVFLTAALTLAALLEESGLAERLADALLAVAGARPLVLFSLVCIVAALLTAAISLDGAVVLLVPFVRLLSRGSPSTFSPLFLASVAVSNAASMAVPQGNPTNLVLMEGVGLSSTAFLEHMVLPGIGAAAACGVAVALRERRALATARPEQTFEWMPLSAGEWRGALALAAAAAAGWICPLIGVAPWWGFAAVVAIAFGLCRPRPTPRAPWRIAADIGGLLVTIDALALHLPASSSAGPIGLVTVVLVVGSASALLNNLPASAVAASLLSSGPTAYAASIGLSAGALATPHGSVATVIAGDLAGAEAPPLTVRLLIPLAAAATLAAVLVLWPLL